MNDNYYKVTLRLGDSSYESVRADGLVNTLARAPRRAGVNRDQGFDTGRVHSFVFTFESRSQESAQRAALLATELVLALHETFPRLKTGRISLSAWAPERIRGETITADRIGEFRTPEEETLLN